MFICMFLSGVTINPTVSNSLQFNIPDAYRYIYICKCCAYSKVRCDVNHAVKKVLLHQDAQ